MSPQAYQFNNIFYSIKPYKKQIIFNVTFHIVLVITYQMVWVVFLRNFLALFK